jgi:hypothetical protein
MTSLRPQTLFEPSANSLETATVSGSVLAGDTVSITATSSSILNSPVTIMHTVQNTDTLATIAAALAAGISANAALAAADVTATATGPVVTIDYPPGLAVTWSKSNGTDADITLAAGVGLVDVVLVGGPQTVSMPAPDGGNPDTLISSSADNDVYIKLAPNASVGVGTGALVIHPGQSVLLQHNDGSFGEAASTASQLTVGGTAYGTCQIQRGVATSQAVFF